MKSFILHNKASAKVSRGTRELAISDLTNEPKGSIPGEWFILIDEQNKKNYIAYLNIFSENFFKVKIICEDVGKKYNLNSKEEEIAKELIREKLERAFGKRTMFKGYESGARLVYGAADELPGLIIDLHEEVALIQINTAGIDRFRDLIKTITEAKFKAHKVYFLDNPEYRKAEILPNFDTEKLKEDLKISENGLNYLIDKEVVQKIGYYYDHRENRNKIRDLLKRSNQKFNTGLDLFCYVGSWGLHLLDAGVEFVDFVDQANMEKVVAQNLEINKFKGRGNFTRSDVFKFIDQKIMQEKQYDIIVSDPPAFTKSEKNKTQALQGYEKLHSRAMKLLTDRALFVAASCTHPVSIEELDKSIQEAAMNNNQKVQLLDLGVQGFDHPNSGFKDQGFYIKYLVYFVTRGTL